MQVHVSPEIGTIIDEAAVLSARQGKYYVGIEHLFDAVLENAPLLPDKVADTHLPTLTKVAGSVRADAWKGQPPSADGEVFYTPRCAAMTREAARLAKHLRSERTTAGHLLLAILSDRHGAPSRAMERLKVDPKPILEDLRKGLLKGSGMRGKTTLRALQRDQGEVAPSGQAEMPRADGAEEEVSLQSFTRDLTQEVQDGELTAPEGRDKEVFEIVQVLVRKTKNNVIMVGEPGVGKTKIIEGLAVGCVRGDLGDLLGGKRILELNVAALMAGTQYRGAFETKMLALIEEMEHEHNTILCIDEIHLIMGAGATDGDSMDLARIGYNPEFGARELKRTVERHIVDPISDLLLKGQFERGDMIDILMEDGALTFKKGKPQSRKE